MKKFSAKKFNKMLNQRNITKDDFYKIYYNMYGFISYASIQNWTNEDLKANPNNKNIKIITEILQCSEDDIMEDLPVKDIEIYEHEVLLYSKINPSFKQELINKLNEL